MVERKTESRETHQMRDSLAKRKAKAVKKTADWDCD